MKQLIRSAGYSMRGALAVAAASLILGGCASSPGTYSNADQSVDFQQYQTYAFMQELATDDNQYQSLDSTYLKHSVEKAMEARGFRKSENPDIVINFSIVSQEKIRSRSVPSSSIHGGFYDPYYGYDYGYGIGTQTRVDQYTEGKLTVVAVDTASNRLVWEGSTTGRLTKQVKQNWQITLEEAVVEVFEGFPAESNGKG